MNAVEIEEAITDLSAQPFCRDTFAYSFLEAFGFKSTTLKKLRSGSSNKSDLGGVLLRNNIHISICQLGEVPKTLEELKTSPSTSKSKSKFVLATDGETFEAEDCRSGETIVCNYKDFSNYFGFFLPLAGISNVKQICESSFDIRATGRLNKLYIELIKDNPDWATSERRKEINHFLARLIFCFFAEDTDIFGETLSFTNTVEQMSESDSSNTHQIISEIFRSMNIPKKMRINANLPRWAEAFPYVNGGLFSESVEVPLFSKIARSYLIHIGNLDWKKINPDIFGSMIQAVAEDEERGFLGMHYTSVPNILKVLNPLFLDDLHNKLKLAGDNERKLANIRNRISKIRIFDPACGSGNFLVIAYKELRRIEDIINCRRKEVGRKSEIPLTNFRGIEIRSFTSEIARLALIISEYQCNVNYLGQKEALAEFLPLEANNWITCGNALRLDWVSLCPPSGSSVKLHSDDLFSTPLDQAEIDFDNKGGEIYICGNPPYRGSQWQSKDQKYDLQQVFEGRTKKWKSLDYVSGWFMKAAIFCCHKNAAAAFVSTNSICQGRQVENLWTLIANTSSKIFFAHRSFKWSNLASHNAGVTVVIVGITKKPVPLRILFYNDENDVTVQKHCENINAYLINAPDVIVHSEAKPINGLSEMRFGNMPNEGGFLLLNESEVKEARAKYGVNPKYIRRFLGSDEFIKGKLRYCIWVNDDDYEDAKKNQWLMYRFEQVREKRTASDRPTTKKLAKTPYLFGEVRQAGSERSIVIPRVSSENRDYLPVGIAENGIIIGDRNFAIHDAPLWNIAIISSRLHWLWIATVCVRMRTDFSYSNTLGWNTFYVPKLTEKNMLDLTRSAEEILLAREIHFPKTIAELYDPERMPNNLINAHKQNDEILERIYIGRQFKNDTERLEKLFHLYSRKLNNKI
ncbi:MULTISPECIES: class I SAM-dependent DNA methyltransferase [Prochlorococcus]|uniref:site-specific DNA-methyltransferase (adenine-specific) n=1 Tax=Prochlorococcus marinus (strain SARG / CCMP1375 / SS120) TaxID=167539 RepID=Q7VCW0_PROMA|nr:MULTISPECIES: DNA methyltransferase [Prochlorococcus]AAP99674.1 Type II restriction enzyme, methylase subunit [Prochlorococcus marinus subsp. marinus str. CCMP1375]KGG13435.1 hypothetical protein EV04_0670 [Prochlorococcus marinus str. LG]KGG21321.1 hypothetical protein EV08_0729 [Prochlorococcus marinus str. SS2]KGG24347.1 hypothetical protein EV09_0394 [Prochlorococcus marinus str. SS35]KGG33631.1 hypothetical protein EV10_0471 [Prochlorococcus marinus str. SS51]